MSGGEGLDRTFFYQSTLIYHSTCPHLSPYHCPSFILYFPSITFNLLKLLWQNNCPAGMPIFQGKTYSPFCSIIPGLNLLSIVSIFPQIPPSFPPHHILSFRPLSHTNRCLLKWYFPHRLVLY